MSKKKKRAKSKALKNAGPWLTKNASGNIVPFVRKNASPICWNGHTGKRGHRFCTRCGQQYGLTYGQAVVGAFKAASPVAGNRWAAAAGRAADPDERELLWSRAQGEITKSAAGGAAAIARSLGYRGLGDAWRHSSDPAEREMYWRSMYPDGGQSA